LATKVGLVLVILALMHFFNLFVFSQIGKRPAKAPARPPVRAENPFGAARY
jgi:hypothetical protein